VLFRSPTAIICLPARQRSDDDPREYPNEDRGPFPIVRRMGACATIIYDPSVGAPSSEEIARHLAGEAGT
jgi:hypothetical protein